MTVQSLASAHAVLSSSSVSGVLDAAAAAAAALLERSPPTAPSRQPDASPLCAVVPHGSTPLSAFDQLIGGRRHASTWAPHMRHYQKNIDRIKKNIYRIKKIYLLNQ